MATIPQLPLFNWQQIDPASDLDRLRLVLDAIPDEPLVRFLEERRGRGRDDYPVRPFRACPSARPCHGDGAPLASRNSGGCQV